ncbi:hypothetical protein N7481_000617 [Penicillium waksmanii]|uniref:uncharacterized protein n=1 Tax=Penicillium waksmanii TaxID=69791 RepID=UPI0025479A12|nr:uncharacterized protein N7481_000617 [Penicillium waksmanii]KAJ6000208.1 hypothetical protein N7481_000617 [Penicillium waksmanii]
MPEEQSLWKYNDEDEDEPFYQHALNGERKSQPSHARGGILADEMGLGKTLVILSVIAGTLDRAKEFEELDIDESQPQIQPQPKLNSQATLILVPSTLFHKHIGQDRYLEKEFLRKRAIVFTTYATLATEVRREASFLSNINWFRIVLDEAHYIRNRATKQFLAVTKLSAQNRWCLTGTPIQNDIEDLGALIAFLKVPVLERPSTFRKLISHPISSNARYRFKNMQTLLHAVCIRRTRGLLEIPEPLIQVKQLPMSQLERSQYRELLHDCKMKIDMAVSGISRQQKGET